MLSATSDGTLASMERKGHSKEIPAIILGPRVEWLARFLRGVYAGVYGNIKEDIERAWEGGGGDKKIYFLSIALLTSSPLSSSATILLLFHGTRAKYIVFFF